jgi:hypothetical protein
MRLIDVVLAGVLLGLIVGFLQSAQPATAGTSGARETANRTVDERITWLRTPALMRRTSSVQ